MLEVGLRIWQVVGKKGNPTYYLIKQQAKEERDRLFGTGFEDAHVSKGPDHDKHFTRREPCGANKGRHPKKSKGQQKSFWGK
jgi:hypothetical protein